MLRESSFDFTKFYSETSDLDLMIDPAQEFDIAVGQKAAEVSAPVHSRALALANHVG